MSTHHFETKLTEDGKLTLNDLPFQAGETVEVIVTSRRPAAQEGRKSFPTGHATPGVARLGQYPLRGTPIRYSEPTEPVADEDWEALR